MSDSRKPVERKVSFDEPQIKPAGSEGDLKQRKKVSVLDALSNDTTRDELAALLEDDNRGVITVGGVPLGTLLYGVFLIFAFIAVLGAIYMNNQVEANKWIVNNLSFLPFVKNLNLKVK